MICTILSGPSIGLKISRKKDCYYLEFSIISKFVKYSVRDRWWMLSPFKVISCALYHLSDKGLHLVASILFASKSSSLSFGFCCLLIHSESVYVV